MLMLICFGPGNQSPYVVIWFPFVLSCRQADAMTMEAKICKSASTFKATPDLLLHLLCPGSVAFSKSFLLLMRSRRFMGNILFPAFGLGLVMKHGMELRRALFDTTTAGTTFRLVSLMGFVGMETAAYKTHIHTLMHMAPTSMMRR